MRFLLLLWFLVGCSPSYQVWISPPPIAPNARTLVLYLESDPPLAHVSEGVIPPLQLEAPGWNSIPDQFRIFAIFYGPSPADLLIESGRLEKDPTKQRSCDLASPSGVRLAEVIDGKLTEWITEESLPPPIYEHLVGETCALPCKTFTPKELKLESDQDAEIIVPLDAAGEALLVGTIDSHFHRVTRTGITPLPELSHLPGEAGLVDNEGRFWLSGTRGRIIRTDLQGNDEAITSTSTFNVIGMAMSKHGAFEIYAIAIDKNGSNRARLLRIDETDTVEVLWEDEVYTAESEYGYVIWLGPQQAIAGWGSQRLILSEDVRTRMITLDIGFLPNLRITALAMTEVMGLVLGTSGGQLAFANDQLTSWELVSAVQMGSKMEAITEVDGGLLLGGLNGQIGQYYPNNPESGFCSVESPGHQDVETIVPVGKDFLLAGGHLDGARRNSITWLFERE